MAFLKSFSVDGSYSANVITDIAEGEPSASTGLAIKIDSHDDWSQLSEAGNLKMDDWFGWHERTIQFEFPGENRTKMLTYNSNSYYIRTTVQGAGYGPDDAVAQTTDCENQQADTFIVDGEQLKNMRPVGRYDLE